MLDDANAVNVGKTLKWVSLNRSVKKHTKCDQMPSHFIYMTIAFIITYTPFSLMQNYAITMLLNIILLDLYLW